MTDTPRQQAAKVMQHYGTQHQLVKLCEECGELIQQAAKCYDRDQPFSADFVQELADVRVMIMQFEMLLSPYWRREFNGAVEYKLYRQLERIENGE